MSGQHTHGGPIPPFTAHEILPAADLPGGASRPLLLAPQGQPLVPTHQASAQLVWAIFGLTYLALAIGKVPGLRIDRSGIALVGAAAMLATGVLSMRDAARAVDYETIVLLFGMMVVVAYLRVAGFFSLATERIV